MIQQEDPEIGSEWISGLNKALVVIDMVYLPYPVNKVATQKDQQ